MITEAFLADVEARIQRAREAKARRFLAHFYAKMKEAGVEKPEANRAALETALALVRSASIEQWKQIAAHMTDDNRKAGIDKSEQRPSGATFEIIVRQLEQAIGSAS